MAAPLKCDTDHDEPATFMVTETETGTSYAWCAVCLLTWSRAMLEAVGFQVLDPAATAAPVDGAAPEEGQAGPTPPRPKRRRQGAQSPSEALAAPESPFPDPTPVDG